MVGVLGPALVLAGLAGCASSNPGIVYDPLEFEEANAYGPIVLDGHTLCAPGCNKPATGKGLISCVPKPECRKHGGKCGCHLYSRDADSSPQVPESWKHQATPGQRIKNDRKLRYRCFCVN